jgi:hypothetical protein
MKWPNKEERESWEIEKFIRHYEAATLNTQLRIFLKAERPDYVLVSDQTKEKLGVELTSVYLSDKSVPDNHIPLFEGLKPNPCNPEEVERYQTRVLEAIKNKDEKARSGYSREYPLVLSVYINEYLGLHIEQEEWEEFFSENGFRVEATIFTAILLWPLPDDEEFIMSKSNA